MLLANPDDLDSILRLLDLAFAPSQAESRLVKALIENSRPIHHWVLENEGALSAYVGYTRAFRDHQPMGWHLAPVAVHPNLQRRGLGSTLIRHTLLQPAISGSSVFVLGDPAYYARFGFRTVRHPTCPFDPSNDHFMALRYEGSEPFVIGYESEFANC
jgi:putative acetyltransferase